jgi:hypothetical protein
MFYLEVKTALFLFQVALIVMGTALASLQPSGNTNVQSLVPSSYHDSILVKGFISVIVFKSEAALIVSKKRNNLKQ